jgi:hypothetical protein
MHPSSWELLAEHCTPGLPVQRRFGENEIVLVSIRERMHDPSVAKPQPMAKDTLHHEGPALQSRNQTPEYFAQSSQRPPS